MSGSGARQGQAGRFRIPVPLGAETSEDQAIPEMNDLSRFRRLISVLGVIRGRKATLFLTTEITDFTEGRKGAQFLSFLLKFVVVFATFRIPEGATTSTVSECYSALGGVPCLGNRGVSSVLPRIEPSR